MNRAIDPAEGIAQTQSCPSTPVPFIDTIYQAIRCPPAFQHRRRHGCSRLWSTRPFRSTHTCEEHQTRTKIPKRGQKRKQPKEGPPQPQPKKKKNAYQKEEAAPLKSPPPPTSVPVPQHTAIAAAATATAAAAATFPTPSQPNHTGVRETDKHCRIWKGRQREGKRKRKRRERQGGCWQNTFDGAVRRRKEPLGPAVGTVERRKREYLRTAEGRKAGIGNSTATFRESDCGGGSLLLRISIISIFVSHSFFFNPLFHRRPAQRRSA